MQKSILAAAFAAAALAGTAHAQAVPTSPFSVEVRAGASIPTGDLADGGKTGYAVGANALYAVTPMVSVYGGYSLASYKVEGDGTLDAELHLRVQGPQAGVIVNLPVTGRVAPFVRGGALVQKYVGIVSSGGDSFSGSDDQYRWGFEAGAGVAVPLGPRMSLTPAVAYTKVEHATAVKVDVGLAVRI